MPDFFDTPATAPATAQVSGAVQAYPERFKVRLAGRVDQIWLPAANAKPMYRAELVVERSRALPWASALAWAGMPIVEPPGEDFESAESADTSAIEMVVPSDELKQLAAAGNDVFPEFPPFEPGVRVMLRWQGQSRVPGVVAGCVLRCSGVISTRGAQPVMYNPRYEIVPPESLNLDAHLSMLRRA